MPMVSSTYRAHGMAANGHVQTVLMGLCRRGPHIPWRRTRYTASDGDFFDVDWYRHPTSRRLVIILHGLEGSTQSAYVRSAAAELHDAGWDVAALNHRGCSGELNRSVGFYHSGMTDDLSCFLAHPDVDDRYERLDFVGFSLGGNVLLKYLGDCGANTPPMATRAVAVSVPCDLTLAAPHMDRWPNRVYTHYLVRSLRRKIMAKSRRFPGRLDIRGLARIRTFLAFDDRYTAPLHGFSGARDYWARASSARVASRIRIPTLLLNARDDPFLPASCYPHGLARRSPWLHLEMPDSGGHLGFADSLWRRTSWVDGRIRRFIEGEATGATMAKAA